MFSRKEIVADLQVAKENAERRNIERAKVTEILEKAIDPEWRYGYGHRYVIHRINLIEPLPSGWFLCQVDTSGEWDGDDLNINHLLLAVNPVSEKVNEIRRYTSLEPFSALQVLSIHKDGHVTYQEVRESWRPELGLNITIADPGASEPIQQVKKTSEDDHALQEQEKQLLQAIQGKTKESSEMQAAIDALKMQLDDTRKAQETYRLAGYRMPY